MKLVFFDDAKYWRSILGGLVCAAVTVALPIISMTRGALHNINVLSWDERILINLAVVFGAITAGAAHKTASHFPSRIKENAAKVGSLKELLVLLQTTVSHHRAFLLLQSTVFLNTAAAVLCKRISITKIGTTSEAEFVVSTLGLIVFACGGVLLGLSVIYKPLNANEKVVEATLSHSGNGSGNGNGNGNGKVHHDDTVLKDNRTARSKALTLVQYPDLSAWLVIISGIALVENAWMPLLSLPGIVVAMKWYLNGRAAASQFAGDGEQLDISKTRWKVVPFIY